jgi:hypothetical protein
MFALVLERDPLRLEDIPNALHEWIVAAGGFAVMALAFWFLTTLLSRRESGRRESSLSMGVRLPLIVVGGLIIATVPIGAHILWTSLGWSDPVATPRGQSTFAAQLQALMAPPWFGLPFYVAACALVAALVPVLENLFRLRWRRIWALAKLSFKEAIRRRVLWAFSALLLVFLFASWFLSSKPEDQVRNYVHAVYWAMTPLLLVTAGLLASFSIPADLKNQTIHTIVTKPVQRFEIIIGRFLGYTFLMSLVLVAMTLVCLVYVARGIEPEAAEESLKARTPIYGDLHVKTYEQGREVDKGISVGYEWTYRSYISGASEDHAWWDFRHLPRSLSDRETVRCEFTLDIFRTTKGEENKGIYATFLFENWKAATDRAGAAPRALEEYRREREQVINPLQTEAQARVLEAKARTDKEKAEARDMLARAQRAQEVLARAQEEGWSREKQLAVLGNPLAEKFGIFELPSMEITDFHTLAADIPAGLFKDLAEYDPAKARDIPPLRVLVRCESATQYLGVNKYDLYLLETERSAAAEEAAFYVNFFKGAVGLWYRMVLVIGIAITCSTFLSGVISFLTTMFLYMSGLLVEFIRTVAEHKSLGGGPFEALFRLANREHPAMPLDKSPIVSVAQITDAAFEWVLGRFLNVIPDVDRFDLTDHIAEGFDISGIQLLLTGLLLAAYLLPWAVLAFYLIRSREVAS